MLDAEEALKDTASRCRTRSRMRLRALRQEHGREDGPLAGFRRPGYPECKNTKPIVERMPGRCPKCGSTILKRKSKRGYAYYACERGAACGFMTWDVPTDQDCPVCGQTMFKRSGKGAMKPFCANRVLELPAGGQARLPPQVHSLRRGRNCGIQRRGRCRSCAEAGRGKESRKESGSEKAHRKGGCKEACREEGSGKKARGQETGCEKGRQKDRAGRRSSVLIQR